jgi:tetratricopeptide (TPR) repeat protein
MKRFGVGIVLTACIVLALPALASGESGPEAFSRGKSLLDKGNLDAALTAFAAAARADIDNDSYRQQYALVRRIVDLRKRMDVEKDPERWEYSARALHAFYMDQGLHEQGVVVARKIHEKAGTASTAVTLAETELALNNNAEAEKMLAALDKDGKSTPMTRTLWGVALARLGKAQEAKKLAQSVSLADDAGPQLAYSYARLSAVAGNTDAALAALQKCFQTLPPSRLENFKEHAKVCPEFSAIASTAGFAKAMETESQVAESKCSGGSGCAGCPNRAKCAKAEEGK